MAGAADLSLVSAVPLGLHQCPRMAPPPALPLQCSSHSAGTRNVLVSAMWQAEYSPCRWGCYEDPLPSRRQAKSATLAACHNDKHEELGGTRVSQLPPP